MNLSMDSVAIENFGDIVDLGSRAIDTKMAKAELLKHGRTESEIEVAFQIMSCIVVLNGFFFSELKTELEFSYRKSKLGFSASYNPPEEDSDEGYTVFVEEIEEKTVGSGGKIWVVDEAGKLVYEYEDAPACSDGILFIAIAAHEVRHRLQYQNMVRLLTPKGKYSDTKLKLKTIVGLEHSRIEIVKEDLKKAGKPDDYIKARTSPYELDAGAVEELVKLRLYEQATFEELFEVVNTGYAPRLLAPTGWE